MKIESFIYIGVISCLLSCNNNNNSQESTINKDTVSTIDNQNYRKENIVETLFDSKDIIIEDTMGHQKKGSNTEIEFNPHAIKLNNKAIELFSYVGGKPLTKQSSLLLDSALILLDKAIKIDSAYYLAYANKANVLSKQKKYKEAIETLETSVNVRENYAEGITTQGFLYEKIGMQDKANLKYQEAIEAYIARLNTPFKLMDRVNVQMDIAFLLLFTEGKQTALQAIDTIISHNPENKMAVFMKGNIKAFNREEFIKSL